MELSLKQIRIFLTTYYMGAFEAKSDFPDGCIDKKISGKVFCSIMKLLSGFCTVQGP